MNKTYKEWIKNIWLETGGLVSQAVACRISGLNSGTISRRIKNKKIKGYKYNENDKSEKEMISLKDAINIKNEKPKKGQNNNEKNNINLG